MGCARKFVERGEDKAAKHGDPLTMAVSSPEPSPTAITLDMRLSPAEWEGRERYWAGS
jgi:hypothetical protein